jgi:hypothetical protein
VYARQNQRRALLRVKPESKQMYITNEENKVIDQLYYLSYQAQRQHYGLSAKQAATVFQSAAKYERIYQRKMERAKNSVSDG